MVTHALGINDLRYIQMWMLKDLVDYVMLHNIDFDNWYLYSGVGVSISFARLVTQFSNFAARIFFSE